MGGTCHSRQAGACWKWPVIRRCGAVSLFFFFCFFFFFDESGESVLQRPTVSQSKSAYVRLARARELVVESKDGLFSPRWVTILHIYPRPETIGTTSITASEIDGFGVAKRAVISDSGFLSSVPSDDARPVNGVTAFTLPIFFSAKTGPESRPWFPRRK